MEGAPNTHEPFELVLKGGRPYRLTPEPGYRLVVSYVTLETESVDVNDDVQYTSSTPVSLSWRAHDAEKHLVLVLLPEEGRAQASLRLVFNGPVELLAEGGNLGVFAYFKLVAPHELYDTYVEDDESALPTLGNKTFTWHADPRFYQNVSRQSRLRRSRKRKRGADTDENSIEAPLLIAQSPALHPAAVLPASVSLSEDCKGEPNPRTQATDDVTPPRLLALVPSSSPERSASRSEDDNSDYLVRVPNVPDTASPAAPPATRRPVAAPTLPPPAPATADTASTPSKTQGSQAFPAPESEAGDDVCRTEVVKSPRLRYKAAPRGVLKRRSQMGRRASQSPALAPAAPAVTPAQRKAVQWNPKSPDVRFITPPLSAMHRAFPGGLLDLGMPMLQAQRPLGGIDFGDSSAAQQAPLSGLAGQLPSGDSFESEDALPGAPANLTLQGTHRPHKAPKVTPVKLRPTVIH